jgi:hypothetical protein
MYINMNMKKWEKGVDFGAVKWKGFIGDQKLKTKNL